MPKIIDVARHAGVSTASVSRALSRPELVSDSVRGRVNEAVEALGYQMNVAARSLRTLRTSKLLVSVPDISNPFFGDVIRGAEEAARAAEFSVVLGDTRNDPALENLYAAMLARREVDGLVFLGHRLPDTLQGIMLRQKGKAPIVNGCEYSPELGVSSVHIDNAAAAADGMRHLIDLGHRQIAIITGPLVGPLSRDRLGGVQQAAARTGGVVLHVRHGDFSVESGFEHAQRLIADKVTAIFCFSDEMALGAMRALRMAGLKCPEDVSVIGFDDIRFAQHMTPTLTTVRQPAGEIGRRAVELLLQHITGESSRTVALTLPHLLVVRESTGTVPG